MSSAVFIGMGVDIKLKLNPALGEHRSSQRADRITLVETGDEETQEDVGLEAGQRLPYGAILRYAP